MVIKVWKTTKNGGKRLNLVKESCYFPEFESLILCQKKTYALIQSIGLFQRNKSLAGFVKYASRVKYCFAM